METLVKFIRTSDKGPWCLVELDGALRAILNKDLVWKDGELYARRT